MVSLPNLGFWKSKCRCSCRKRLWSLVSARPCGCPSHSLIGNLHVASGYAEDVFSPGDAATAPVSEVDEFGAQNRGFLDIFGVNRPLDLLAEPLDRLFARTGLRIRLASTSLSMVPLGVSDTGSSAAGDLDLMALWTLTGRGTLDTGTLVTTVEYRHDIGNRVPADLFREMGTLIAPSNGFNDRGRVLRDSYWIQRLFDARLRILIGRADPSDYVGAHGLQNVNNSFVSRHFSANPAVPFPGHGPLIGVSARPNENFYVTGGISNAYSRTDRNETRSFFTERDYFTFVEMGITPEIEGLGRGRYAIGVWHMAARSRDNLPADEGLTVIAEQPISARSQVFARYSYADATLTNVRHLAQIGYGLNNLFGRGDDLSGLALSIADPRRSTSDRESVIEAFHRFQVTRNVQFTIGAQAIFDPGNNPDESRVGAIYSRLRIAL